MIKKEKQKTWISLLSSNIFAPNNYVYQVSLGLDLCTHFCLVLHLWCGFLHTNHADITFEHISGIVQKRTKMRTTRAFLSIFAPYALISARCPCRNPFCYKISYMHYDLEIMSTKFHGDQSKNAQYARIFVHFCTFRADFCEVRARKTTFVIEYHSCIMTWRSCLPSFMVIGAKMRATRAFLSIFAPSARIYARCARGNHFCYRIS